MSKKTEPLSKKDFALLSKITFPSYEVFLKLVSRLQEDCNESYKKRIVAELEKQIQAHGTLRANPFTARECVDLINNFKK